MQKHPHLDEIFHFELFVPVRHESLISVDINLTLHAYELINVYQDNIHFVDINFQPLELL